MSCHVLAADKDKAGWATSWQASVPRPQPLFLALEPVTPRPSCAVPWPGFQWLGALLQGGRDDMRM